MEGRLALLALALALLALAPSAASAPRVVLVPDDYSSIQAAVDAAPEGTVVAVRAGVYRERPYVIIRKPLTLVGEGPGKTVIEAGEPHTSALYVANARGVTVAHVTVRNLEGGSSLHVTGSERVRVVNVEANNHIAIFRSSDVAVTNCTARAVIVRKSRNVWVAGNAIRAVKAFEGIVVNNSTAVFVSRNRITDAIEVAVMVGESDRVVVAENSVAGPALLAASRNSTRVRVYSNYFEPGGGDVESLVADKILQDESPAAQPNPLPEGPSFPPWDRGAEAELAEAEHAAREAFERPFEPRQKPWSELLAENWHYAAAAALALIIPVILYKKLFG